jgi:hypothetical protein
MRMPLFTAKWNWVYATKLHSNWKEESRFFYFYRKYHGKTSTKVNVPIVKAYINQLREVYADADETELMKMAKNAGRHENERDEIDENDWVQIKPLSKKRCKTLNFRRDEGMSLEKEFQLRIGKYSSIHDRSFST